MPAVTYLSLLASKRRLPPTILGASLLVFILTLAGLYADRGMYGLNAVARRGATFWVSVAADDPRLSASMRLALHQAGSGEAGRFEWQRIDQGFDVGELPVIAANMEVDRILLARIDPARFRFVVRNAPAGDKDLGRWLTDLKALLVINGSFYAQRGTPETPLVSAGALLGPRNYDAKHGAFVASTAFVGLRDLASADWRAALQGADDAIVSYPLLLASDGSSRAAGDGRWLANRSFVGQDRAGRIVLGTTTDAFFSLNRLAAFLRTAPLDLTQALNLDGGPLACQGITLNGYRRDFCGQWELAARDGELKLLRWTFGTRPWALPIVLAVLPKDS
jgi:hypothetical protein